MTKQQWITQQLANFPGEPAYNIASELNKVSLVNNPATISEIPYPATVEEVVALLDSATTFAVQNTQTWAFIDRDLKAGETRYFIGNLDNLLGGGIISQSQHTAILTLLQATATRTIPDPNYQSQVYKSPAQLAGYENVFVHEIQEVIDSL